MVRGEEGRDAHPDLVGLRRAGAVDGERHVDEAVPDGGVADDVASLDRELHAGAELGGRERRVLREHFERGPGHLEEAHAGRRGRGDLARRAVGRSGPRLRLQAREVVGVVRAVDDLVRGVVALGQVDVAHVRRTLLLVVVDVREEHRAVLRVPHVLAIVVRRIVERDDAVAVRVRAQIDGRRALGALLVGRRAGGGRGRVAARAGPIAGRRRLRDVGGAVAPSARGDEERRLDEDSRQEQGARQSLHG